MLKATLNVGKMNTKPRYFDIAVNLTDAMFQGTYNNSSHHESDIPQVILRAKTFNVTKMLVTGSSVNESRNCLEVCEPYKGYLYSTVGVHPCSVEDDFYTNGQIASDYELKLDQLREMAIEGSRTGIVKSFGEIGLDYARLHYTSAEHQKVFFQKQLDIASEVGLPLFLHMRDACDDFIKIIKPYLAHTGDVNDGKKLKAGGVVHSFTGSEEELNNLLELGFYIGVNGCSLKSDENLKVAALIPLDKLMIETDSPWCEIRKTHAGYKYITPYPNNFYPEIKNLEKSGEKKHMLLTEEIETVKAKQNTKKQQIKKAEPKLDPNIPFPVIKSANYNKHYESNPITGEDLIGKNAHPLIKSRNEPVLIGYVAEILSHLKNVSNEDIINASYHNSCKLFGFED